MIRWNAIITVTFRMYMYSSDECLSDWINILYIDISIHFTFCNSIVLGIFVLLVSTSAKQNPLECHISQSTLNHSTDLVRIYQNIKVTSGEILTVIIYSLPFQGCMVAFNVCACHRLLPTPHITESLILLVYMLLSSGTPMWDFTENKITWCSGSIMSVYRWVNH